VVPEPKEEQEEYQMKLTAYISHSETDIATLLAREVEDARWEVGEGEAEQEQGRKEWAFRLALHTQHRHQSPHMARIFTHHPAASHQENHNSLDGTILHLTSEDFSLCSTLPLAREMFLTHRLGHGSRLGFGMSILPERGEFSLCETRLEFGLGNLSISSRGSRG
jgi:hypothetical protein